MAVRRDYTARALRIWARFPVLTYVGIQVNFWVVANLLLGIILHLQALRISRIVHVPGLTSFGPGVIIGTIFGILYGIILGLAGYHLEKTYYRKMSLGKIILLNTVLSLSVQALLLTLVRVTLVHLLPGTYAGNYPLDNASWGFFYATLAIYYFFMTLLISFINQVNKKYGPGVLLPLLLGKYKRPREEERIFLFMDLKSSTTLAEKLGHLRYSSFIQDSFLDINNVVLSHNAEIYQYVGDEIILSWSMRDGISEALCIQFYFACRDEIQRRESYYQKHYGTLPEFKAGLHGGMTTAVEIGNIKREIAYHGDVLNTAARIQGLCNEYGHQMLISAELLKKIDLSATWKAEILGQVMLKGKMESVEIAGISKIFESNA